MVSRLLPKYFLKLHPTSPAARNTLYLMENCVSPIEKDRNLAVGCQNLPSTPVNGTKKNGRMPAKIWQKVSETHALSSAVNPPEKLHDRRSTAKHPRKSIPKKIN